METCPGCGFKNAPGRESCLKCGAIFRSGRRGGGGLLVGVAVIVLALLAGMIFLLMKPEPELRKRPRETDVSATAPPPASAGPAAAPPAAPEPEQESPTEKRGKDLLRQADAAFAKEDYPAASALYLEAKLLGISNPESLRKLDLATDVANIIETRDYFGRGVEPEPAWITAGKWKFSKMDPAKLPSDAWRAEYQRLKAILDKADQPKRRPQ